MTLIKSETLPLEGSYVNTPLIAPELDSLGRNINIKCTLMNSVPGSKICFMLYFFIYFLLLSCIHSFRFGINVICVSCGLMYQLR